MTQTKEVYYASIESTLREIAEDDPYIYDLDYNTGDTDVWCNFCGAKEGSIHEGRCLWQRARSLLGITLKEELLDKKRDK